MSSPEGFLVYTLFINVKIIHFAIAFSFLRKGGINPTDARLLHEQNIQSVYEECLRVANISMKDVDAIAVTTQPGLPGPLIVGRDLALNLSKEFDKPIIPIHHMKAHALTIRMIEQVKIFNLNVQSCI